MNDNHEANIFLRESTIVNIYTVIKAAADRGTFKLEEFGAIATLIDDIKSAMEHNRIEPPAPVAEPITATTADSSDKE